MGSFYIVILSDWRDRRSLARLDTWWSIVYRIEQLNK